MKPFPTIEQAYAHVRGEAIRQQVIINHDTDEIQGAILASKGLTLGTSAPDKSAKTRNSTNVKKCSHCSNQKHTCENCFQLHGYPDWWHDLQARKRHDGTGTNGSPGKVAIAAAEPHLSLIQPAATSINAPSNLNFLTPTVIHEEPLEHDRSNHEKQQEHDGPNDNSGVVNCEADVCPNVEHATSETKPISPHSEVPVDSSPENTLEVSIVITPLHTDDIDTSVGYVLPHRDYPLTRPSGNLTINMEGNLVILHGRISFSVSELLSIGNSTTSATLLDSGNLVLRDSNSDVLWQSFDYPSDTFLPGMKLGNNKNTRKAWTLTSCRSEEDPAPGAFSMKLDPENSAQFFIMQGSEGYWTSGLWNGENFSIVPKMRFKYSTIFFLDLSGQLKQLAWLEKAQE
ncbi:hypothetical protein HHK36_005480 [Tetracentron sinense]|uniref:Bulb-type lectin domain-containing protein n=1 Tax=Tetracentron sinense TaxID=13715 RepID=A0A834ZL36_TETSI|nr:hypothetical protein HHK36_005480 [Tetracentron sinense]